MTTPPDPFTQFSNLFKEPETLDQAAEISRLFEALPEFQRQLRERRRHVITTLHERDGISYTDMAPKLGVKPERVSGIARGHSRSSRKRD